MLVISCILHFIIDGICAYSMFASYRVGGAESYLFYNLCAFALQMPFGALADLVVFKMGAKNRIAVKRFYWCITLLGILFTVIGMYAGVFSLGVGNALFHVGGGLGAIKEDEERSLKGSGLGVFVAPGALGIFAGKLLADVGFPGAYVKNSWIALAALLVLTGFLRMFYEERHLIFVEASPEGAVKRFRDGIADLMVAAVVCFLAVIIRSFVGLAGSFEWKKGFLMVFLAAIAVVSGKAAGGFLAAGIGKLKAVCISLVLSAVCFAFSSKAVFGLLALLFFNMTMPVTLHILVKKMPLFPGFSFGLLTFGLFLGFLPEYLGIKTGLGTPLLGVIGSLLTLLLLLAALLPEEIKKKKGPSA
ncbi:MAG: hypothetical protein IJ796_08405 [Lachnospiraceae bacterium]|nr:hypothetical protein [Lachnospiraceae bacterium]